MGVTGLEPSPESPGNTEISGSGGAKSGALPDAPAPIDLDDLALRDEANPLDDPDLAAVVAAWGDLPEHIRRAIVALIGGDR